MYKRMNGKNIYNHESTLHCERGYLIMIHSDKDKK